MYQLLIVDDELPAVTAIQSAINWSGLGIAAPYTAFNVRQAKEIFADRRIDIMLCDIEMPQGSGLELLAWVREQSPHTECIFLTCHEDFKYVKKAIQLGSLDYIVKPIPYKELEQVIVKALDKIEKNSELMQFSQYWFRQQPLLIERFWLDIVNRTITSQPEALKLHAVERNIPFDEQAKLLPVIISVQRWHKKFSLRDEKIMEFALRNSAEEMLLNRNQDGILIRLDRNRLLALFYTDRHAEFELGRLEYSCQSYIASCNGYFYCDLSCYLGERIFVQDLPAMMDRLFDMEKNNVAGDNKVLRLSSKSPVPDSIHMQDMKVWSLMLQEGLKVQVIAEATFYLENRAKETGMDAAWLHRFHQDFVQMVYHVLQLKGVQAHKLFGDEFSMELSLHATRSLTDLIVWMNYAVGRAMDYAGSIEESLSVVDKVNLFIANHLDKISSREDIANHVFLNADYLDRIFKKEMGMSVSEYVYRERVGMAKELLGKTDLPVSSIAAQVGYDNFSHFSRMFKKYTAMSPLEYRQKYHRPLSK